MRVRWGPRAERLRWFQVKDLMRAIATRDAEQAEMREAMRAKVWLPRAVPRLLRDMPAAPQGMRTEGVGTDGGA